MEKEQQKWTAQGCNNMEIDQVQSMALETSLLCLGFSTAALFFPWIQP